MKRVTDKLIALQFPAAVLPIAVVLLVRMVVDARRAEEPLTSPETVCA